jgi:uncharacterized protein (DUF4415 family)
MAKKRSASSAREKLTRVSGADILKHGKKPETIALLKRLAADESEPDYSDVPEITDEQWAQRMSVSEYFALRRKKQPVTVRLDKDIVAWLQSEGEGYQTRMNAILREAMTKSLKRAG